jgi:hypothetical protein
MTRRIDCPPAPGPLEEYAARFDDLFTHAAQRRGFRDYLAGLPLPRARNKTLTVLAGAAPLVEAQEAPVQRLQSFLSESVWDAEAVNARRLERAWADAEIAPHEGGVLVLDATGDRKDGAKTAHVAHPYLGSVGKIANGSVAVTSLWADERAHCPLHVVPYTPAARLPQGQKDPALRTKPQRAAELVGRAQGLGGPFRAVGAASIDGESAAVEGALWRAGVPYVRALRPSHGTWGPADAAPTPADAAREGPWTSAEEPGGWTAVQRRFRDGHSETGWAAALTRAGYEPGGYTRLVAATTDPAPLPAASTWEVVPHLPHPPGAPATESARARRLGGDRAAVRAAPMGGARLPPAERGAGLGRLPGPLRPRHPAALAARLLCLLVLLVGLPPPARRYCGRSGARHGPRPGREAGGGKGRTVGERPMLSWPVALRQVQGCLDPWTMLWRYWRAWSSAPPPPALQALLDALASGRRLHLPLRI